MKKIIFSAGILAGVAAAVSCSEELKTEGLETSLPAITKTMVTEANLWTGGSDTKSIYEPEVGITMTGTESMAVFYGNPANAESGTSGPYMQVADAVKAEGDFKYTVTHDEIPGVEAYDYCVLSPYLYDSSVYTSGDGRGLRFELSPVQMPGQNAYDYNYDILYGKGTTAQPKQEQLIVNQFKRITAPVRFELYDKGSALEQDEKIHAVTVSFSKEATDDAALSGLLYMNASTEDYDNCRVNSINSPGNAVTALYPDGLSKTGDCYPVWFMVNPASFEAQTELSVTVITDRRTFVKTITIPSAINFMTDKFNVVSINLSSAVESAKSSLYFDFTSVTSLDSDIMASDDKSYSWNFASSDTRQLGLLPRALRINNGGSVTFPTVPGYKITGIRLYANPANINTGNFVSLNDGESQSFASYDGAEGVSTTGGVLYMPVSGQSETLILTASGANVLLSGIALELEESVDDNDYYALYNTGHEITINGKSYSKETNPVSELVLATELTNDVIDAAEDGAIIFIDPTGQQDAVELTQRTPGGNIVLVGTKKNLQPKIRFADSFSITNDVAFKNIELVAGNNVLFRSYGENVGSLLIEDCTVDMSSSRYLVYDQAPGKSFPEVTISNCIINFNTTNSTPTVFNFSKADDSVFGPIAFTMKNSVVYSSEPKSAYIVNMSAPYSNSSVELTNNTLYNIGNNNSMVYAPVMTSLAFDNNVIYSTCETASYLVRCETSCDETSISGNHVYAPVPWTINRGNGVGGDFSADNTQVTDGSSPFISTADAATGYFPITEGVGAGADYDTKYWITRPAAE